MKSEPTGLHWQNRGTELYYDGQKEEAIACYKKALALNPSWELHLALGNLLFEQNKLEEALEIYQQAIKLNPNSAEGHWRLGVTLDTNGDWEKAAINYKQALTLNPYWEVPCFSLGSILARQGKADEAIECYHQAISLKPNWTEVYVEMANALAQQDRLDEAFEYYQKALKFQPNWEVLYVSLGSILARQGKADEAIECYHQAISLKPNWTEVYFEMANALAQQDRLDEAFEYYQKALKFQSNWATMNEQQKQLILEQEKLDKAQHHLKQATSFLSQGNKKAGIEQLQGTLEVIEQLDRSIRQRLAIEIAQPNAIRSVPGILFNTLPKSGSIYIANALANGLSLKQIRVASDRVNVGWDFLQELNLGGAVAQEHLVASESNLRAMNIYLARLIIHVRDPRQALVSLLYFMNETRQKQPLMHISFAFVNHPVLQCRLPNDYYTWSLRNQIDWLLMNYLPRSITWIDDWVKAEKDPSFKPQILFTRYEDFKNNSEQFYQSILDFYDIDSSLFSLPSSPKKGLHNYRQGSTNEWRQLFTLEQIEQANSLIPSHLMDKFRWTY